MDVEFTRSALIGERAFKEGDRVDLNEVAARRHLKAGSCRPYIAVESAVAPCPVETAEARPSPSPRKRS